MPEMLFVFDEFAWEAYTHDVAGPVGEYLHKVGERVAAAAKRNATGNHAPNSPGPGVGPNVITGNLRGSIGHQLGVDEYSAYVDIGTSVEYAGYVEFGTSRAPAYPFLRPAMSAARI